MKRFGLPLAGVALAALAVAAEPPEERSKAASEAAQPSTELRRRIEPARRTEAQQSGTAAAQPSKAPEQPRAVESSPPQASTSNAGAELAATETYVPDILVAEVLGVSPKPIVPDAQVMVDVVMKLRPGADSRAVARELRLLINGVPLMQGANPLANLPTRENDAAQSDSPRRGDSNATPASGSQPKPAFDDNERRITLFGITPKTLKFNSEVTLSVYSVGEQRNIATASIMVGQSTLQQLFSGAGTNGALVVALGVALLGAGVYIPWRRGQQRVQYLERAIEIERGRVNERANVNSPGDSDALPSGLPGTPEPPEALLNAYRKGDLCIIVGAGVSAQSGLPTSVSLWLDVIDYNTDVVPAEKLALLRDLLLAQGQSDAAINAITSSIPADRVTEALQRKLGNASPSPLHKVLADLTGVRTYVDLTWDRLLPEALRFREPRIFTPTRFEGITEAARTVDVMLLKPLGDVHSPGTLILTAQDLRRANALAPEFQRTLSALLSTRNCLFLGMSFQGIEQFLTTLPPQLESTGREHFALTPYARGVELWSAGYGQRYGITLIPYQPTTGFPEVKEFVERIAQSLPESPPWTGSVSQVQSISGPGKLSVIRLENIGVFKQLDFSASENWTLFLGDNGGGKSTILRALTLALAGDDPRGAGMAQRLLRNGADHGVIEITLGSTRLRTNLVRDGARVVAKTSGVTPLQAGLGLVLAFPALRGVTSAQPKGPKRGKVLEPSVDDVLPLLEERVDTRLDAFKQWVVNTALDKERDPNGREAAMFKTFSDVIAGMVPGRDVRFSRVDKEYKVWLKVNGAEVQFDSLSQGTSSVLNWLGLLLQRLYDVYPRSPKPEEEPALVLIDEIDAHLHPQWQRKLVTLTRERFPHVQIVASSHSPLLAGSVKKDELRIVEPQPNGEAGVTIPREDMSGQKAEDILTSSMFALTTTRSLAAERIIDHYFELLQNPNRDESESLELRDLQGKFERLNFGPSIRDREALQAHEAQIKESIRQISGEDIQRLRQIFGPSEDAANNASSAKSES